MKNILLILCLILSGCNSLPKTFICHKVPPDWAMCEPKPGENSCIGVAYRDSDMEMVCEEVKK